MKTLKLALAVSTVIGGISFALAAGGTQTADEAHRKMSDFAQKIREYGIQQTFALANGHSDGGTNSSKGGTAEDKDHSEGMKSDDSEAGIICVHNENGKWVYVVNQLMPRLVGQSATDGQHIWRDGVGIMIVEKALKALATSANGEVSIDYVDAHGRVKDPRQAGKMEEKKELLVVGKSWLAGRDHKDTYGDFFCATAYSQLDPTDEGDNMRLTDPDRPHGRAKMHKAAHHKKDAKHEEKKDAKHDDKKKDDKKDAKKDDKKADAKKDEPKKEEKK
jgi:hypothetical protein